jgi:hypothetical protein
MANGHGGPDIALTHRPKRVKDQIRRLPVATISTSFSRTRRVAPAGVAVDTGRAERQDRRRFVPTLFGWTPGMRVLLAGRVLACGCLVGIYETRSRGTLTVLDGHGQDCTDPNHQLNILLDDADDTLFE